MTKDSSNRRVKLEADRRRARTVDVGALEGVDVEHIADPTAGREEALKRAGQLVGGREVYEAILPLRLAPHTAYNSTHMSALSKATQPMTRDMQVLTSSSVPVHDLSGSEATSAGVRILYRTVQVVGSLD